MMDRALRSNLSLERTASAPWAVPTVPLLGCTAGTSPTASVRPLNSIVRPHVRCAVRSWRREIFARATHSRAAARVGTLPRDL